MSWQTKPTKNIWENRLIKKLTKSRTKIRIADEGAPMEAVNVLGMAVLIHVKRVEVKLMVLMSANSKSQPVIAISEKATFVQCERPNYRKTLFRDDPAFPRTRT